MIYNVSLFSANPKKSKRTQNVSKKKQMLPSLKTDVFFNFGDQVAVEVVFALTKVDVMWQVYTLYKSG